jgi:hypothetical protein
METNKKLETDIAKKEADLEKLLIDTSETEQKFIKEKDDPLRLEKNNESLQQGLDHLTG